MAILIVDDEPLILWSLRQALLARGHDVVTAGSGVQALEMLLARTHPFGVVILDYRLPDRRDLTLAEDVRRLSPVSVIFMMTAFADDGMRAAALDHGVQAVIEKPFYISPFVSLIETSVRT